MGWRASTFGVAPDSGTTALNSAWFVLDSGEVWGINVRPDDIWDNGEQGSPEIIRLTDMVRVNVDDTVFPETVSVANNPDGLLAEVPLEGWADLTHWCTDGTYVYFFSDLFGIRRLDFVNLRVDTLVGRIDTHPDLYSFYDSHDGSQAYPTLPMPHPYVDRLNRYLYWWDRKRGDWSGDGYPPSKWKGVGAYLRRMSLDGSHAVETVSGRIDSVQHPSGLARYRERFYFNYRDPTQGEAYVDGFFGIASVNAAGGDFKLHYVDPRDNGADDSCGFMNHFAPITFVGDQLVTTNGAGVPLANVRNRHHRVISFDMSYFLNSPDHTFVHNPADPIYEVVTDNEGWYDRTGQPDIAEYRDGDRPLALGFITPFTRSSFPGWEDKILFTQHVQMEEIAAFRSKQVGIFRVLEPNTDIWDVQVLFTGEAYKGYDHVYEQYRTGPLEFDLYHCEPDYPCVDTAGEPVGEG